MFGMSEQAVLHAIRRGELAASRQGRTVLIVPGDLEEYRERLGLPAYGDAALLPVSRPGLDAAEDDSESPLVPALGEAAGRAALPSALTPFVGRADELAILRELISRADVRLITLTGPGGVGKTRLALEATGTAADRFADGVALVPLAVVQDPALIPSAIVQALGIMESDYLAPAARLQAALRGRQMLLILDNFEHLVGEDAGMLVAAMLESAPGVKALVTSRALLHLSGEHVQIVPPLRLPDPITPSADVLDLDAIASVEAVQLFVDRSRAAWPEFGLTAGNAAAVAAICQRVDGLPLAIELAAARGAVLSPAELLERLEHRLPLLSGGPQDRPRRLRTMRSAIAWSYDLLDEPTRARFRWLAVLVGRFSLPAAEAVAGSATTIRDETLLDSLTTLLTSSLIHRVDAPGGTSHFGMLETVREFALEQLQSSGEERAARAAHAAYYLDLARQAEPLFWTSTNAELIERIETEHDNLRAALTWALEHDPDVALALASAMGAFWSKRSFWTEGRDWLRRALATGAGEGAAVRASALGRLGALAGDQADFDEAERALSESLALAERLGETHLIARAGRGLAILASNRSDFPRAEALFNAALAFFRELSDQPGIARSLNDLGLIAERQGDHDRAIVFQEEALPIARAIGDDWQTSIILGNLGGSYYERGEYARGQELSQEALDLSRKIDDTFGVAVNLYNLGNIMVERNAAAEALVQYREALALTGELGERHLASRVLDRIGVALHLLGNHRAAARLFGAAAAFRESIGDSLFAEEETELHKRFQHVRDALSDDVYRASWEAGRSLPLDRASAEAAALASEAILADQTAPARTLARLTVREVEVLRLLVDGLADREIAEALFISTRTASSHVAAILAKLGAESRTAAVAAAFRGGLV